MKHISKNEIRFFKRRFVLPLRYSFAGLKSAWESEEAFRFEACVFTFASPVAFFFGQSLIECIVLLFSLVNVLVCELFNTAIENAIDRVSGENHDLSRIAKDVASAAVFLSIFTAFIIWTIFGIKFFLLNSY